MKKPLKSQKIFSKMQTYVYLYGTTIEPTPKSQKPLNPLKGTLKSSLIFNEFPFRGQG
jgi:hypothetical protein